MVIQIGGGGQSLELEVKGCTRMESIKIQKASKRRSGMDIARGMANLEEQWILNDRLQADHRPKNVDHTIGDGVLITFVQQWEDVIKKSVGKWKTEYDTETNCNDE